MEGFFNGKCFKTMIDTGSPVTIFALDEIKTKTILKREKLPVRHMTEGERYFDFNGKSIIGREWLTTLRYKLEPQKGELEINS